MNEQDKILLSAYLDSDLNDAETLHVEELLQSSDKARDYLESMKQIKLENKNFFENSLQSQKFRESSNFLKKIQTKQTKKFSLYNFIFERKIIFSNIVTASVAFFFFISFDQTNVNQIDLFENKNISIFIPKTRDLNSISREQLIINGMSEMIDQKTKSGIIKYGASNYRVFLHEKNIYDDDLECYEGEVFTEDIFFEFQYCINMGVPSISFSNFSYDE